MGTKFTPEFIALQRAEMDCPFSSYRLQAATDNYRSALDEIEALNKEIVWLKNLVGKEIYEQMFALINQEHEKILAQRIGGQWHVTD